MYVEGEREKLIECDAVFCTDDWMRDQGLMADDEGDREAASWSKHKVFQRLLSQVFRSHLLKCLK